MISRWPDCVLTYIDLIGTKANPSSKKLRQLHRVALAAMQTPVEHQWAYCWNDSVLLLAEWDKSAEQLRAILEEARGIARKIDEVDDNFIITVKGQLFPAPRETLQQASHCHVLRTSSYAMGNIFLIESWARKNKIRKKWYLDSRLRKGLAAEPPKHEEIALLPAMEKRKVYLLDFNEVTEAMFT